MVGGSTSTSSGEGQKTLHPTQPAGRRVCVSPVHQPDVAPEGHLSRPGQAVPARVQWPSCALHISTGTQFVSARQPDFSETSWNQNRVRYADAGQRAPTAARRVPPQQRDGRDLQYTIDMMEPQSTSHVTGAGHPTAGYRVGPVPTPAEQRSRSATASASPMFNSAGHPPSVDTPPAGQPPGSAIISANQPWPSPEDAPRHPIGAADGPAGYRSSVTAGHRPSSATVSANSTSNMAGHPPSEATLPACQPLGAEVMSANRRVAPTTDVQRRQIGAADVPAGHQSSVIGGQAGQQPSAARIPAGHPNGPASDPAYHLISSATEPASRQVCRPTK